MSAVTDGWGVARTRTITWHDPAVALSAAATMSGRDYLQAIIDGELPRPPFAALTGAELVRVDDGVAVFRFTPEESTLNPLGVVHGGMLCTLLDSAAGCAVHTMLPSGVAYSTIEIKVSFLAAVRADTGAIEAEGRVLRVGRQVAFAEAHARAGDGKLVGHATTSIALSRA